MFFDNSVAARVAITRSKRDSLGSFFPIGDGPILGSHVVVSCEFSAKSLRENWIVTGPTRVGSVAGRFFCLTRVGESQWRAGGRKALGKSFE